jgi:TetR/AcrR family transcriptional repressor of mexJK operon
MMSFMRPPRSLDQEKAKRDLEGRLELFYRGILP